MVGRGVRNPAADGRFRSTYGSYCFELLSRLGGVNRWQKRLIFHNVAARNRVLRGLRDWLERCSGGGPCFFDRQHVVLELRSADRNNMCRRSIILPGLEPGSSGLIGYELKVPPVLRQPYSLLES
jgi:hypothetical protein